MNRQEYLISLIINIIYILILGLFLLSYNKLTQFIDGGILRTITFFFTTLHYLTVLFFIYKIITPRKITLFFLIISVLIASIGEVFGILSQFETYKLGPLWDNSSPIMILLGTIIYAIIILQLKNHLLVKFYALSIIIIFLVVAISVVFFDIRLNQNVILILSIPPVIFITHLLKNKQLIIKI